MEAIVRRNDQPGLAEFAGCLEGGFLVPTPAGPVVRLTLIEATALPVRGNPTRAEPFSVVFRGPVDGRLPQGLRPFEHPELGVFELFIVPIAPDGQGPRYEAIFN